MKRLVKFIWGLILFSVGIIALCMNIDLAIDGNFPLWRIILVVANLICIVMGSINIYQTTEQ